MFIPVHFILCGFAFSLCIPLLKRGGNVISVVIVLHVCGYVIVYIVHGHVKDV